MRTYFLFIAILFFAACKKSSTGNDQPLTPTTAATMLDVSYGTDAKQKIDVYLPANRSADTTKVILLIHGGGWDEGDKADFTASVTYLQTLLPSYAFININYRLVANGQNIFPTQENDVKAATEFVYSKRATYGISDKWVIAGASAGGHLAMLQSYKYTSPVKPKAVVSFFGPSDLTALYNAGNPVIALLLLNVTGTIPALNASLYQQSSPVSFITAQSPPTLLLHGGADPIVPPAQSILVRDKLQAAGVANQYVFYPNDGHGWTGPDLIDSYNKIVAFIQLHVN